MTTSPPRISVILPVHNAQPYVDEAVQSIREQTFTDFEFLIIDDGSTDNTLAILQRHAAADPRIRLVTRPNDGYISALNTMLESARGEFIARMDGDDVAMPRRFELQVGHMERHPDVVALGSRVLLIDPEGWPLQPFCDQVTHEQIDGRHISGCDGAAICHPAAMLRRVAVQQVGGYRPQMWPGEDLDLFLRLAEVGKLGNLPDMLLHYRLHPHSTGAQHRVKQIEAAERAVAEARVRRGLPPLAPGSIVRSAAAESPHDHLSWAWRALMAGYVKSARKHALRAVRRRPASLGAWKCFACALRGY